MGECAFCDHDGKLSNEHIVSKWIGELFSDRLRARYKTPKIDKSFATGSMDWKARVVCEKCNNSWMSEIENDHAKPVLTPLIKGINNIPIGPKEAGSIALFAFKTAVILDFAQRPTSPFFSKRLRRAFKAHLSIPVDVNMWMCAYANSRNRGDVRTHYGEGKSIDGYGIQTYVCTCAFGHFAFQVLTVKQIGRANIRPIRNLKNLTVKFWPKIGGNIIWPPPFALQSIADFDAFATNWKDVVISVD